MDHYGPKGFKNGPKLNHFPFSVTISYLLYNKRWEMILYLVLYIIFYRNKKEMRWNVRVREK